MVMRSCRIFERTWPISEIFESRCRAGALGTIKSKCWLTFEWSRQIGVIMAAAAEADG